MKQLFQLTAIVAVIALAKVAISGTPEFAVEPRLIESEVTVDLTTQVNFIQSQRGERAVDQATYQITAVPEHRVSPDLDRSVTQAQILRALRVRTLSYQQCYSSRRATQPSLEGSVIVKIRVVNGKALSVNTSGTMPDHRVNECVGLAASRAPFPKLANIAEITYPIFFSAE